LNAAGLAGQQPRRASGLLDGLPRLGQLDLLDAFGRDGESDGLSLQFSSHDDPPVE